MRFPRLVWLVCMALALMAASGCRAGTPAEIPLSSVAKELQASGYRVQKSFVRPPSDWEISKFRLRQRVVVAFKAEQPMPSENETYYCRFALAEETYDSGSDASQRLAQLHDASPEGPAEDEYTRLLREGFVVDRTLYILQTDAAKFLPEIRRLTKTLAASRTGRDN